MPALLGCKRRRHSRSPGWPPLHQQLGAEKNRISQSAAGGSEPERSVAGATAAGTAQNRRSGRQPVRSTCPSVSPAASRWRTRTRISCARSACDCVDRSVLADQASQLVLIARARASCRIGQSLNGCKGGERRDHEQQERSGGSPSLAPPTILPSRCPSSSATATDSFHRLGGADRRTVADVAGAVEDIGLRHAVAPKSIAAAIAVDADCDKGCRAGEEAGASSGLSL